MRILVEGDSWAYTWSAGENSNQQGPGFADILRDRGWNITVTATPGGSNLASLARINNLYLDHDLIIWIQTEPLRDWLRPQERDSRLILQADAVLERVRALGSLDSAMEDYLHNHTYRALAMTPRPVWVMGGCSVISSTGLWPNLTEIVDSIPNYLFRDRGDYQDCYYQNTHQWATYEYADRVIESRDPDLIADWYSVTKRMNNKLNYWTRDSEFFNPDNWHPNQAAHQQLADLIEPLLITYRDSSQYRDFRDRS